MAVMVFIRELSFKLNKVLDSKLERLLSALYNLHGESKSEFLKKEAVYTLRTLSKYSSDVKLLYYILMMPEQMFTKYKLPNAYCLNFILQKEHLNVTVFEEELLEVLVKTASELFADAHQTLNDLGEEIVVNLFKRFMDRKKADVFLKMVRVNVSKKRSDQILKFLKLNFENLEEIVQLGQKIQALDIPDAFDDRGKVFRTSGQRFLAPHSAPQLNADQSGKNPRTRDEKSFSQQKRETLQSHGKRNHKLQEDLMQAIHQLINT